MAETGFTRAFGEIGITDIAAVGGKNASLGEMIRKLTPEGIRIPAGFAVTSEAFWEFIYRNQLKEPISGLLDKLDRTNYTNLAETGKQIRSLILAAPLPEEVAADIQQSYQALCETYGDMTDVAVRSSATAEDLPTASFAGQHDSYLNVRGGEMLLVAVRRCYASLFNDRAIKYREDRGFDHLKIAISAGVQKMIRSDMACAGIGFTLDPESGFRNVIHISGAWGLGENIVQGAVNPDEFFVFKPSLEKQKQAIISRKTGSKALTMVYADHTDHEPGRTTVNIETKEEDRSVLVLSDEEVLLLARWAMLLEKHYQMPMDFEWAKDGADGELYLVQARPETVHSQKNPYVVHQYFLKEKSRVLAKGNSVGNKIASGIARIIHTPEEGDKLQPGEILVTETTNPDWNPLLKKAAAIVTDKGGRTSHASIVARELGITAMVGAENASKVIRDGQPVTVACHEGNTCYVYDGLLKWEEKETDLGGIAMPETAPMLILGDPEKAFNLSFYPSKGVGLMRLEFVISNAIRVHPMALAHFEKLKDEKAKQEIELLTAGYEDKRLYFIDKLSQAVGTIAAAFYPREVIVRMSDFKTNEYAGLLGGKEFEPVEENPMIGFRGASRYDHDHYRDGFRLECEAMKCVRDGMGLDNVKLMIPFCRTLEEGSKVVALMESYGLKRGENGLQIYVMVEIPSNVLLADGFAKIFDGFSIGSNDLTQLTLGIDRDSEIVSGAFSEKNPAVTGLIREAIAAAKRNKIKIGLCGQAPSDDPAFAQFLIGEGIDSISFNPDALLKGITNMLQAEEGRKKRNAGN